MSYQKKTLRIYDKTLTLTALVDDYATCSWQRSHYEVGSASVEINLNIPNASKFVTGYFVQFGTNVRDIGVITKITDPIDEGGKGSQKRTVTIKDARQLFARRYIMYLNSADAYALTAAGETVIKTLISDQCGPGVTDSKRRFGFLVLSDSVIDGGDSSATGTSIIDGGDSSATGTSIIDGGDSTDDSDAIGSDYALSEKYSNVLDSLVTVATQTEVGWYLCLDVENKTLQLCFRAGDDLSAKIIFSPSTDTVKTAEVADSLESFANMVYVGGDGSGTDRTIYKGFDTEEPEDIDRFETFDDASTLTDEDDLANEATSILKQYNQKISVSGDGLAKSPYQYGADYDVGDKITIRFGDIDETVRILSITETWEYGDYNLEFEFGKPIKGITDQLGSLVQQTTSTTSSSDSSTNTSSMKAGVKTYDLSEADKSQTVNYTLYNIIELSGTLTADRTFTFYLSTDTLYGRKVYHLLIDAVGDTVTRTITLTTGISGKNTINITVTTSQVPYLVPVMIDSTGNVIGLAA